MLHAAFWTHPYLDAFFQVNKPKISPKQQFYFCSFDFKQISTLKHQGTLNGHMQLKNLAVEDFSMYHRIFCGYNYIIKVKSFNWFEIGLIKFTMRSHHFLTPSPSFNLKIKLELEFALS